MGPEALFQKRVQRFLEKLPRTFAIKVQQKARKGDPDLIICVAGHYVAMELKASEKAKITALQIHKLQTIANAGGLAMVVCPENWAVATRFLEKLLVTPQHRVGIPTCLNSRIAS